MTLTGLAFGLFTAWLGYWYSERQYRREIGVRESEIGVMMIEIALNILAGKPDENKPENKPLRDWAVKILAFYSPNKVPLTEPAKSALLSNRLPVSTITFDAVTGARRSRA